MAPEITIALATTALGVAMTTQQVPPLWRALASRRWVRTKGRILSSRVVADSAGRDLRVGTPVIQYEYDVGAARLQGNVVNWNGFTYRGAIRARERYAEGEAVTVWYDPRHPDRAVLEPGARLGNWVRVAVAVAIVAAGLLWAVTLAQAT